MELARAELEPLMLKYGVDLYFAGHEHNYETTFPIRYEEARELLARFEI